MQRNTTLSLLLAGMMAAAGVAHAQSTPAAGSSSVPPKAGEASTQVNGVPNAMPMTGNSATAKSDAKAGAMPMSTAAGTSKVPNKAGEASTSVKGQPNANPDDPMLSKSKSVRKEEKAMKKADSAQRRNAAVMGQKGAQAGAPAGTPPNAPAGTPSVQEGGTPK